MSKVKSVVVKETAQTFDFAFLESLPLETRAELFAMLKRDNSVISQAVALNEARVNVLQLQKKEIENQISALNSQLAPILSEIRELTGKNVKAEGTEARTRIVVACPKCHQKRHADNDKTRACSIYPGYKAEVEAAKNSNAAIPTFPKYLEKIGLSTAFDSIRETDEEAA